MILVKLSDEQRAAINALANLADQHLGENEFAKHAREFLKKAAEMTPTAALFEAQRMTADYLSNLRTVTFPKSTFTLYAKGVTMEAVKDDSAGARGVYQYKDTGPIETGDVE
ncbi:hypothetical protein CPT_Maja_085 [Burkholderia phage Maja]|uniref:Uncharacterized protein n=1 Tax=Burkholderia phage Maja TaxID=2767571 RepID=A0A7S6R7A4_9CAUD|nr:hypothetical protein CPT_Maja_085 [Burkholderia phage Maja]